MSRTLIAQLVMALKSDVAAGASKDAAALKALQGAMQGTAKASKDMAAAAGKIPDWGKGFTKQAVVAGATASKLDELKKSWAELHKGIQKGDASVGTARILWKNEALANLAAVRAAQKQLEEEGLKATKQRMAAEKRMLADMERDKLKAAREELKQKQAAEKAALQAEREARKVSTAEARASARYEARLAREKAQEATAAAREAAREQIRIVRQAQRDARGAEREARVERRRALGVGGAIVGNIGHAIGLAGGAYAGARGARYVVTQGAKGAQEQSRQFLAGFSAQERAQAAAQAYSLSAKYPSVGNVEIQQRLRTLFGTFGDFHHAQEALPEITRAQTVLGSLRGMEKAGHDLDQLITGLEGLGAAVDPERFKTLLNGFVKGAALFGDRVSGDSYRQFVTRAMTSGLGNDDAYLSTVVPTMIQHIGSGSTFGTMQRTAFQALVGGRRTKPTTAKLKEMGLLGEDGHLIEELTFIRNPYRWVMDHAKPLLDKQGLSFENSEENKQKLISAIGKMFSAPNAGEFFASLLLNSPIIEKDLRNLGKAQGTDAADEVQKRDAMVGLSGLQNAIGGFAQALTEPIVEAATPKLTALAQGIARFSATLNANPEVAKLAGYGAGAVAVTGGALTAGWLMKAIAGEGTGVTANLLRMGGGAASSVGRFLLGPLGWGTAGGSVIASNLHTNSVPYEEHSKAVRERIQAMDSAMQPNANPLTPKMRAAIAAAPAGVDGPLSAPMSAADVPLPPERAAVVGQEAGQAFSSGLADRIMAAAPEIQAQAGSLMDRIRAMFAAGVDVPVRLQTPSIGGTTPGSSAPSAPARASGGSVYPGSIYRVNEFGDEYFQPAEAGQILNQRQIDGRSAGAPAVSPSITNHINMHVHGVEDLQSTIDEVFAQIDRKFAHFMTYLYADYGFDAEG